MELGAWRYRNDSFLFNLPYNEAGAWIFYSFRV